MDDAAQLVSASEAQELYLIVHGDAPVSLVHEEHATLEVDPGVYRVVRQREYRPTPLDEREWDWVNDSTVSRAGDVAMERLGVGSLSSSVSTRHGWRRS